MQDIKETVEMLVSRKDNIIIISMSTHRGIKMV